MELTGKLHSPVYLSDQCIYSVLDVSNTCIFGSISGISDIGIRIRISLVYIEIYLKLIWTTKNSTRKLDNEPSCAELKSFIIHDVL